MSARVRRSRSGGRAFPASRLRTISLRRRVTASVVGVLVCALAGSGLLVVSLFNAQSNREAREQLVDRGVVARQLDSRNVPPERIAHRISGRGVLAKIVRLDGSVVGPAAGLDASATRQRRVRTVLLPSGAALTLLSGRTEEQAATARLGQLLVVVGAGTVGVTAVALLVTVGIALRPLDAMTALATSTARGRRGGRLTPERSDTELGRAASAFDEMLDSLEGAESAARESEARIRRFVADAAHQLRTPTAGIQAAAETLLHAGAQDDPEVRERMTALLIGETKRASRLVDDLLWMARIDAGLELAREPVDLLELARAEVERMRLVAPSVRWRAEGVATVVTGDRERIGQVLTNLLENAQRHSPCDGVVRVRVTSMTTGAEVTVTDEGPGVPVADRERVFERLARLEEHPPDAAGGAGLGLAIARGIARAHGGDLTCAEPASGPGAEFRLTLPA